VIYRKYTKRWLDGFFSVLLFLLLVPALILISFTILAVDGRPILFRQKRPGLKGRVFSLYKFRTMRELDNVLGLEKSGQITKLGKFLRRMSIDEIPSLINIIRGEMSFIGPRPLLVEYLPLYDSESARRHEVLPGLTGLAQIGGRNSLPWSEKFRLDVDYVDKQTFLLDFGILFRTAAIVVAGRGVYGQDGRIVRPFVGKDASGHLPERALKDRLVER
jgi:lipopolysaccharide/colanic/teichoic acid biosynthesis glycosyltransferase